METIKHPYSEMLIEGEIVEVGDTRQPTDLYSSSDGTWKELPKMAGTVVGPSDAVWVRPRIAVYVTELMGEMIEDKTSPKTQQEVAALFWALTYNKDLFRKWRSVIGANKSWSVMANLTFNHSVEIFRETNFGKFFS